MIDLIPDGLLGALGAAVAAIVAAALAYWRGQQVGRSVARTEAELDALRDYRQRKEEMDNVEMGHDPDAARRFLRERGEQ